MKKGAFSMQLMRTEGSNGITALACDDPGKTPALCRRS
jgi:hypothetical protein